MNKFLFFLTSTSNQETNSATGSTEKIKEALVNVIKSPLFYIILATIFLLIVLAYLLRRIVKARPNSKTIIVRHGKIHKIVDDLNPKYFLRPFIDRVGAVIYTGEKELSSDKLFINDGPDHLYQINFTLTYEVIKADEFYQVMDNIDKKIVTDINDTLREYADEGNALVLIKDYRNNTKLILDLINKAVVKFNISVKAFKVNMIQPLGR